MNVDIARTLHDLRIMYALGRNGSHTIDDEEMFDVINELDDWEVGALMMMHVRNELTDEEKKTLAERHPEYPWHEFTQEWLDMHFLDQLEKLPDSIKQKIKRLGKLPLDHEEWIEFKEFTSEDSFPVGSYLFDTVEKARRED